MPQNAHPNGPRTFATVLRDNVGIEPHVLQRLIALEEGRHPTLSALREALGLDIDTFGAPIEASRAAWPDRGTIPDDDDIARIIDAMYRALRSSRLVRVDVNTAGPAPTHTGGTLRLRDEEHLQLLIVADNHTGEGVLFSAESHGVGIDGSVEPNRTASSLLDAGAMHPGSYLLPVMVTADGRAATVDLPIECRPSGTLSVRIVDDATGQTVPARVYLEDDTGPAWPASAHIRTDVHRKAWFHADGSFSARITGRARMRVARGIEYEHTIDEIAVAPDATFEHTVRLKRWSEMAADGWYSGDVHVHLHYGGEYLLEPEDASLAQRAEDVHFMNMMVANQGSGWVHDQPYFSGENHTLSTETHILRWGEEYRNDFYGHMCMYGITALVPPIYSGFTASEHSHDLPANASAARHCHDVGGTLSYAHPMFAGVELDRVFAVRRTVEAKELPVDAALGLIDAVDVMSYPGHELYTSELWYRLLNCGLRLAATAGTDTFMNMCESGPFSNPPAGDRVFVRVDGPLTTESWCAGVRAGRTFVTDGPMMTLTVNGAQIGDEITASTGDVLHIEAEAGSYAPMERIEIIVNGEVAASARADEFGRHAAVSHELPVDASCWIAARVLGPTHEAVLDQHGLFAHTSPIYVMVDGAPVRHAEHAAYFVEWIDRLIAMATERGRYPSDAERDEVIATFRRGQAYFRQLA